MAGELEDYGETAVAAARAVIIELVHLLGEYREDVVLVGGWIPSLLMPDAEVKHVGSAGVDLAINHQGLPEAGYETIEKLLLERGYEKVDGVAFQYLRNPCSAGWRRRGRGSARRRSCRWRRSAACSGLL